MKIIKQTIHPRIQEALLEMSVNDGLEFYSFFLGNVNFYEAEFEMGTCAVGVHNLRLAFFYTSRFVESLEWEENKFVILHEIAHLLNRHGDRIGQYKPDLANIAQDMIINHLVDKHHNKVAKMPILTKSKVDGIIEELKEREKKGEITITNDPAKLYERVGETHGVVLDPGYKGELVFEQLYEWLQAQWQEEKQQRSKQDKPDGDFDKDGKSKLSGLSKQTCDLLENAEANGQSMDQHIKETADEQEIREQLVKEAVEKAKMDIHKTRGVMPAGFEEMLNILMSEPKNNNLKTLRRVIASVKGRSKDKSYRRLPRRPIPGIKGKVREGLKINAILDVSGSMWGEFDIVLTELFRDGYEINLIQADTAVNKVETVKDKKQLPKLKIKGGGGTVLQPAVEYVMNPENKLVRYPTVILTDGYCDTLDFGLSPHQFLILTTHEEVKYSGGSNVKQIKIEK